MTDQIQNLRAECKRQEESCLYTSTCLYIWLRRARFWRRVFVTTPIVLGGFATWSVLNDTGCPVVELITAACALGAGIFPALFVALDMNRGIDQISRLAAEFKNLQDRFRVAADVSSYNDYPSFESSFNELMARLEAARSNSVTPPERFFNAARKKIESGDYSFSIDSP